MKIIAHEISNSTVFN